MDPLLVLVVDDEVLVQEIVVEALVDGGYDIDRASSASEAMLLLDQKPTTYRAIVTDIRLGKSLPTGWDVAKHARELNPSVSVVYVTGDSAADWPAHGVPKSVLIEKPFAPAQIATAVSQLINEATV